MAEEMRSPLLRIKNLAILDYVTPCDRRLS
jgi:hypothetical protein